MIQVELIRAWPSRHEAIMVDVADNSNVADALLASGWTLDHAHTGMSVFGIAATETTPLHAGDRVEFLRGLQVDPKQARRLRAQRGGKAP